jgi:2-phospho-L-lactate guanylyltransferase (CobY/MobA/RfbA family)
MIFALLPVKILSNAKQRLAGHLTAAQRETLARKMYEQTLAALLEANALVRTPPDVIESRFGPGSLQAHLEQARARGVPAGVLRIPGLMFDIDTPEDVNELLARAPECNAARFLRSACASR